MPAPMRRAWREDWVLLGLSLFVLVCAQLLEVTPGRDGVTLCGWRLPESCGMKVLTGRGCPSCGITRSVILSLRGAPEAFRLHLAGPFLVLVLVAQLPYRAWRLLRTWRLQRAGLVDLALLAVRRRWLWLRGALILLLVVPWFLQH